MTNEVGKKYGKLTVLKFDHINNQGNACWLCSCECGMTTVVKGVSLRNGRTTSCGCVKQGFFGETHGYSDKEKLYGVWEQMRSRCRNKNNPRYKTYGGKGIEVCEEWEDYGKFREWSLSNGYREIEGRRGDRMSIDRIDPSKGYSPSNCRWITLSENIRHRHNCQANQR